MEQKQEGIQSLCGKEAAALTDIVATPFLQNPNLQA